MARENIHKNEHSDFLLRYLTRLADHGAKMNIMLNVHGLVITGELVGNGTYLHEMERTVIKDDEIEEKWTTFSIKCKKSLQKKQA